MNPNETVERWMTPAPYTVSEESELDHARRLMTKHGIRHLPVLAPSGKVVGVLSEHDVVVTERFAATKGLKVGVAMETEPYLVARDAPLKEVARTMSETARGAAVVVHAGGAVGVFTGVDALRALGFGE